MIPRLLATSPFDILSQNNDVVTQLGVEGTTKFSLADIAYLLSTIIFWGGFVILMILGIMWLFTKDNIRLYSEIKAQIISKCIIIWLAASAVPIFNLLKKFFDIIFGFITLIASGTT